MGKGESEVGGGECVDSLLKVPGGGSPGGRGAEGPGGCLRRTGNLGGGGVGLTFFFSGPKCPPSNIFLLLSLRCG